MRVLLINPNVSADMTERIAAAARKLLPANVEVIPATGRFGATVIASRASYAIAAHAALEAYAENAEACDAVLLACFGDPGLEALREVSDVPVAGLLDASLRKVVAVQRPFGIVTAGAPWRAMLEERVMLSEAVPLFRGVEILDLGGLAISRDPDGAMAAVETGLKALAARGAETVILGGAAMVGMAARLQSPVPLIDCLEEAIAVLVGAGAVTPRPAPFTMETQNLSQSLYDLLSRGPAR